MNNAITTLVGEQLEGNDKWIGTWAGVNGFLYGIPSHARRVVKFYLIDNSITDIGPDFGHGLKWYNDAMADN